MQPVLTKGFTTSEFTALVTWIVKNAVVLLVLIGKLKPEDQDTATNAAMAFVGAAGVAVAEGLALWAYIKSRFGLKSKVLDQNGKS